MANAKKTAPKPAPNPAVAPPPPSANEPQAAPAEPVAGRSDDVRLTIEMARALPEVASGEAPTFADGSVESFVGTDGRVMRVVRTADGLAQAAAKKG